MADPIFLLCTERSGSNLIRVIMDAHSAIHAPAPTHIGQMFRLRHTFGDLDDDQNWHALVAMMVTRFNYRSEYTGVSATDAEVLENVRTRDVRSVYLYLHQKGLQRANKRLLFLKENHTAKLVSALVQAFDKPKFVFQVRDPRDYARSCRNAARDLPFMGDFSRVLDVWAEDQTRSLQEYYNLGPERVYFQRYEDLIRDPESVLRGLCAFLGVPFEQPMLSFHESESAKISGRNPGWRNVARPLMRDNAGKYRRGAGKLSSIEVRMLEARLGRLMDRFGYEREYPAPGAATSILLRLHGQAMSAASRPYFKLFALAKGLATDDQLDLDDEERKGLDCKVTPSYRS
jgi:hypothetical protein